MKECTVRVNINGKVMLFGNSYKPWELQFKEFISEMKKIGCAIVVSDIELSNAAWVHWGGLKWCSEDTFQEQLNREGCQDSEPDNPNPRQYSEMVFYKDERLIKKVKDILWLR